MLAKPLASHRFDLLVIGAGPAGYVAAIKAAQLGLSTACIEKSPTLGGTCLNVGCIPSKSLLANSLLFHSTSPKFLEKRGIILKEAPSLDLSKMMQHKDQTVAGLARGIEMLFSKNKVTRIQGTASLKSPNSILVTNSTQPSLELHASNIIIATGSDSQVLQGVASIDEVDVVSSTGALCFATPPKRLVVVGGGVIGLELGSVWSRLGSQVTVVEFLPWIGGAEGIDEGISKAFQKILQRQGIKFALGHRVTKIHHPKTKESQELVVVAEEQITDSVEQSSNNHSIEIPCDKVLLAIGRRPFTSGLNLEGVGISLDSKGRIPVNSHFQTCIPSIRAIGDVIPGPMLAHKAEEEAIACVESIASSSETGESHTVNYEAIPSVIYTHPEVAWVGASEQELIGKRGMKSGLDYTVTSFPFAANSRARTVGEVEGMVKILSDASSDKLLGVHIVGANAGELIHEAVLGIHYGASRRDLANTCHAHPTFSEAVKEACLEKPIHM